MSRLPLVGVEEIGSSGPILDITIRPVGTRLAGFSARGLIDTGASVVCISQRIADQLNLTLVNQDRLDVAGGGSVHANIYSGYLAVSLLNFEEIMPLYAVRMPYASHNVLLGRDFLRHFLMTFDGPNGRFHFSRPPTPMIEDLDG